MATVTYGWDDVVSSFLVNDLFTDGDQAMPSVATLAGGGYFATWDDPVGSGSVQGRVIDGEGVPLASQFLVNSTTTGLQTDSSIVGLGGGGAVVTFTDFGGDPGGDIRARLFDATGTPVDLDFLVADSTIDDVDSDVAALADGGFVVSWTRDFGGGDRDIRAQVFEGDGTPRGFLIPVRVLGVDSNSSQVTGLADGNFVVVWQEEPAAGGDSEVYHRIFDAEGVPVTEAALIDSIGTVNEDIQVAALADGGFAVAYADDGWAIDFTEITVQIFNADGSPRTGFLLANTQQDGIQENPSLTVLSNGYLVVGWSDGTNLVYQAYDPDGSPIGDNFTAAGSAIEGELAALSAGLVANVRSSTEQDAGLDESIRSSIAELIRTTVGDATHETLTGDSLRDVMSGLAGNDTLDGGGGPDRLRGGLGDDTYIVDEPEDVVVEALGQGHDEVLSSIGWSLSANVEDLTLLGAADIDGGGNGLANVLTGNGGDNTLDGGGGDDTLMGHAGDDTLRGGLDDDTLNGGGANDTLIGGSGDDSLNGRNGMDTASYAGAGAGVTVALIAGAQATGGAGTDTLANIENLTGTSHADSLTGNGAVNVLDGGSGSDLLMGLGGNDSLLGGVGVDTLVGGAGRDILTGGANADFFDFNAATESGPSASLRDVIADFVQGSDRIDLATIDADTSTDGDQAFAFIGAAAFSGVAGQLRSVAGANTLVSGDIDGDASADFQIRLTGTFTLAGTDFIL